MDPYPVWMVPKLKPKEHQASEGALFTRSDPPGQVLESPVVQYFPRISSPFCFFAFLGFPLFSTNQAKNIFFAGVLIPAKSRSHPPNLLWSMPQPERRPNSGRLKESIWAWRFCCTLPSTGFLGPGGNSDREGMGRISFEEPTFLGLDLNKTPPNHTTASFWLPI